VLAGVVLKGQVLGAGTLAVVPAKRSYYIWTDNEEAIVQVQFVGRSALTMSIPATTRVDRDFILEETLRAKGATSSPDGASGLEG
jgi:hypothetical protein